MNLVESYICKTWYKVMTVTESFYVLHGSIGCS